MIEEEMKEAARNLDFERAMELRDILFEMKTQQEVKMKLNIFTSTTDDGIMSNEKKYFPNLTKEEREILEREN